ncbi:MAG: hypothetical protein HUJ69_09095, partial [Lachnospiraceae bacterium]|nr:hypothetical protein [Lachnospiraceae bacterium]
QETSPAAEAQAPARTMHAQGIQEIVFPLSEGEPVDLALAPGGAVEYGGQYGEFVPEVGPEAVPEVDNPAQEVSGETLVVPGFGTAAPSEGGTIVAPAPAAAGEDPMASTAQSILMDETEESATDLFEEFSHRVGPDR